VGYKILLADDSVTVQKIITLTFSDEGVDVLTVNNGDEAINRLQYQRPALVMADVSIPGKNGYEICEFIKTHPELKTIPVILLVPAFEPFDEGKARRVGADHYLTKPFQSIRTLISTVKSLIEPDGRTAGVKIEGEDRRIAQSEAILSEIEIETRSGGVESSMNYFAGETNEDSDHVLDLDDVLSEAWAEPATELSAKIVEKERAPDLSQLTLPRTAVDEIVDRVTARVIERLPDALSRELARRIAPEVIEIIRQEQMTGRAAYQESDSLLELDEV
jgi:CheY-like chemotaxis protein